MDVVFKSFCPVSNLSYISKLVERFAADQLVDYVTQNRLGKNSSQPTEPHSTETALTWVRNDILLNMYNQRSTCLVLLDLLAAFGTLDHVTLLNHLEKRFKITEVALKWIESYLSDRSQAVVLKMRLVKQLCQIILEYQWVYPKEVCWALFYSHYLQHP